MPLVPEKRSAEKGRFLRLEILVGDLLPGPDVGLGPHLHPVVAQLERLGVAPGTI